MKKIFTSACIAVVFQGCGESKAPEPNLQKVSNEDRAVTVEGEIKMSVHEQLGKIHTGDKTADGIIREINDTVTADRVDESRLSKVFGRAKDFLFSKTGAAVVSTSAATAGAVVYGTQNPQQVEELEKQMKEGIAEMQNFMAKTQGSVMNFFNAEMPEQVEKVESLIKEKLPEVEDFVKNGLKKN